MSLILIYVWFVGLFTQVKAVELSVAQSKISSELMMELNDLGTTETTLAYVEMQDVDHDAVMAEFARRYPTEYSAYITAKSGAVCGETTEEDDALLQRAIEYKRAIYREFYLAHNRSILDNYMGTEKLVHISEYAPMAVFEMDEATAISIARCGDVLSISEVRSKEEGIENCSVIRPTLTSDEIVEHLDLSNEITRASYLRDVRNLTGSGIKIGILEAYGVPDTTDEYLQNASITIRSGDETVDPHATIVTLILAAVAEDGTKHGVVPDAQFYCAKIKTPYGGDADTAAMYSDIEWMISNGVNIINASIGNPWYGGSYDVESQWIDHVATVHDVHFVAAAGNDSNYVKSPGMAYNAITVGGFYANGSDAVPGFSMYAGSDYVESGIDRPEKPNLVANVYFGTYKSDDNGIVDCVGTSFAAPQVAGVIAQLCCWDGNLKYRQSVVGAVLAASAAEKVNAVGSGYQGDFFTTHISGSEQISNVEGAGILDARWAWGILANHNYWNLKLDGDDFPYEKTVTINTSVHTLTRIAIFWTKNNTDINHTTNTLGNSNPPLTNLDLYIYDSQGNLVASSSTLYSNFEIVQFIPTSPGVYTIRITGATDMLEYVGLALW